MINALWLPYGAFCDLGENKKAALADPTFWQTT
jgi:hypothetical protein